MEKVREFKSYYFNLVGNNTSKRVSANLTINKDDIYKIFENKGEFDINGFNLDVNVFDESDSNKSQSWCRSFSNYDNRKVDMSGKLICKGDKINIEVSLNTDKVDDLNNETLKSNSVGLFDKRITFNYDPKNLDEFGLSGSLTLTQGDITAIKNLKSIIPHHGIDVCSPNLGRLDLNKIYSDGTYSRVYHPIKYSIRVTNDHRLSLSLSIKDSLNAESDYEIILDTDVDDLDKMEIMKLGMKVVDYSTGYVAVGAYDDANEDGKYGEPNCDYAIIEVEKYLIDALKDIKKVSDKVHSHVNSDFNPTNVSSIEFSLNRCSICFFGDNPDLDNKTELYEYVSYRGWGKVCNVDNVEGNYDSERDFNDGTIDGYRKDHIKLTEETYEWPSAIYYPQNSSIVFKYNPDNCCDYRTVGVDIDYLIDFMTNHK